MRAWSWFCRNVVERKLTLFRYAGAPVSVNLTVLVILLPSMVALQGVPIGAVSTVLLVALVAWHELGHAWVCRRVDAEVVEVNVGFPYGYCAYAAEADRRRDGLVAWGGVLAQGALLAAALVGFRVLEGQFSAPARPRDGFPFAETIWHATVGANATLIVVNLLPLPGLDGWRAWPLLLPSGAGPSRRYRPSGRIEQGRWPASAGPAADTDDEVDDRAREVVAEFLERARERRDG